MSGDFEDDAAYIHECRDGYAITVDGKAIRIVTGQEDAERVLYDYLHHHNYFPNCYYVNERGNVEQFIYHNGNAVYTGKGWV